MKPNHNRLTRLEQAAVRHKPEDRPVEEWSDEELLAAIDAGRAERGLPPIKGLDCEEWFLENYTDRGTALGEDPEYSEALADFRLAMDRARVQKNPSFSPPADFMPGLSRDLRLLNWRHDGRFPDVFAALNRLHATHGRVCGYGPGAGRDEMRAQS